VQTKTVFRFSILSLFLGTLVACGGGGGSSSSASSSPPASGGQFQSPPANAIAVTPKD